MYKEINKIQNREGRFYLGVRRNSSNLAVRGDMGWRCAETKVKIEVMKQFHKTVTAKHDSRNATVYRWLERRKSSWDYRAIELVKKLNLHGDGTDVINYCMATDRSVFLSKALTILDSWDRERWHSDVFNDKGSTNGNILRTYRLFKQDIHTCHYVNINLPRKHRSILASPRFGNFPITIERGRYTRPIIPLSDRLCTQCNDNKIR
jgi:hypothetical protein